MKTTQIRWNPTSGWQDLDPDSGRQAELVLVFANHAYFHDAACYADLKARFANAHILGCSSAGNVLGTTISDDDIVATAMSFENGYVKVAVEDVAPETDIEDLGVRIMENLNHDVLNHVFILSDGLRINGSDLAKGLNKSENNHAPATGGLAGDGPRFNETWVMADGPARQGCIAALGFYGGFVIKSGCYAGWEEFGAERVVTRSEGNVVYELDDQPALALYKKYLGGQASELPASGLRFPLSVRPTKESAPIIRTLLAVDEVAQSLTYAGDVPEGRLCKLMKTNLDNLIDNAAMAAAVANSDGQHNTGLCLVVSCVGRRMVLGQMTEEELEVVRDTLGTDMAITGFYSYGELAPYGEALRCQLHNQTMTLTTVYE